MVSIKPEDFKLSAATLSTGSAALDNQINALNQSNKAVESSLDEGAGFSGRKNSGSAFLPSAAMIGGAVAFNRDKKNIMELDFSSQYDFYKKKKGKLSDVEDPSNLLANAPVAIPNTGRFLSTLG